MQNNLACNNFQPQLWRAHVCMNCFQIDTRHDRTQISRSRHSSEPKRPNGILKRHNLKPLTPEFPPRSYRTSTLQTDWLTPQPQTKIATPKSCTLTRKEIVGNIIPINMDILLQSRTEPDGQLDEPQTNSPPSVTGITKKQFVTPSPLRLQAKKSVSPGHISDSPVTPQVPPYAVSIVDAPEVQDFYTFNQLEQMYNEKQSTPRIKDSYPATADRTFPSKFPLFQVNPVKADECISKPKEKKEPSISTDSGTEMDAINTSPVMRSRNSLMVTPENESKSFKGLLSPKILRKHKSDGSKKSSESLDSGNNRSHVITSCIPIRFPRWSQKKRPKEKELKSPRRKELCIDDIHVLPPGSVIPQTVQKDIFPKDVIAETSPQYCGIASLSIEPQGTQTPKSTQNGALSPIKPDAFSPTGSHSHHYLPLNLVPMSAINSREVDSRFPVFSSDQIELNLGKRSKPFPTTPNASQEREEPISARPFPTSTEYASPISKRNNKQAKPSRTFRTDNTHLLRYKSKSEMNLGVVSTPSPFFDGNRVLQFRNPITGSITPYAVKPEIPAFPPNASLASIPSMNSGYMQPNQFVNPRPPVNKFKHVRSGSLYENSDVMPQQLPSVIPEARNLETASTSDLLESQNKLARPPSINPSDSGSYVQMRIDQAISDEIGQAVTMYKKIVTENNKLVRLFSDQLHKQAMQVFEWNQVEWSHVEIVDNQRPPLNIAMLVQQNGVPKEFSLWPKEANQDDATSRAFQSIQSISNQIPRNQYVLHAHKLIDIPQELREKCPSLQQQQTCVLDQTRAGSLEQHLVEHKPLLDLDPERYEHNMMLYMIQILSGVAHMHRHKLVHRDLNLSDILLARETEADEILQVKISGFTYALHRPGPPRAQPFLYTFEELQWLGGDETKLPPEITNAQNNVPELNYSGTDCFAVGCLIYEMMSVGNPFEDQNLITKSYTTEELPNFQQRSKYTIWIQKVAKGLLEMNIQRRLDATFALSILQLTVFDGEKLLTDTEITEKKVKAYISDLQGKFLTKMIEKSSLTLLTGRALELNVFEKIELNFLANSQPFTIVRAIKHLQNIS